MPADLTTITVSGAVYAAPQRLASGFHRTPDEVLANLLHLPAAAGPLAACSLGPDFRAQFTDADPYPALLGWIAVRHAEKIVEACRPNQARPIAGTPSGAIMNRDPTTKRRFLSRVLEFLGCRDDLIAFAGGAIGLHRAAHPCRFAALVA